MNDLKLRNFTIGNSQPLILMGGMNVLESRDLVLQVAEKFKLISDKLEINYIFKGSFDKANRSSVSSFRGPGMDEGLKLLQEVSTEFNVPVVTDIHEPDQAKPVSEVCEVVQIPAFLARQTDLVVAAAKTNAILQFKKPQFLSAPEMKNIIEKCESAGNSKITLCERGNSFGYNNLVVDTLNFQILKNLGKPAIFDVTHSLQLPGGLGNAAGGRREYLLSLAKAGISQGIAGLFLEAHPDPDKAKCDGPCALRLDMLEPFLQQIKDLDVFCKKPRKFRYFLVSMASIQSVKAIQVLDSRGLPTVSCNVILDNGIKASAIVPSGASTGTKEALELRDGGNLYMGKGVQKAVSNINELINPLLEKLDPNDQQLIDQKLIELDGTSDKSNIGANAILAVSLAVSHAAAKDKNISLHEHFTEIYKNITGKDVETNLPMPMLNILNGGEHADNNIDIQEFMIIPKGAKTFKEVMRWSSEIYWNLKSILQQKKLSTGVGDEGGFAPNLQSNEEAIKLIIEAIKISGLIPGDDVFIALDCAASEFYDGKNYNLAGEGKSLDSESFSDYLESLVDKYPIISIEDGMDENDSEGWKILTERIGSKCQLVGDDLFVTNKTIFQEGIENNLANSILIKFNQIGSITETIETINIANQNNYKSIISHRSGETEDTTISDLAVGLGAGQIKTGAPCRSDRVAKYNRLLWIEEEFPSINLSQ